MLCADIDSLDAATDVLLGRLDQIQGELDSLKHGLGSSSAPSRSHQSLQAPSAVESSRDFLQIPPHRASADSVLEWEIFGGKYGPDTLIGSLFQSRDDTAGVSPGSRGLHPPDEERIPALIDSFLQNVHIKNPLLDVETLVKHGRTCAERGVGWDGLSCLVLPACALGTIAKPFSESIAPRGGGGGACSVHVYSKELQQAESCFALACRRIGLLTHTLVGAQCHFFAGGKPHR